MTSEKALDNLYQGSLNPVNCVYATFRTGASEKITDDYNIVKKDLEVLEIIKANKNIIFSKKPNYEDMSANDFFKISRWLENVES